MNSSHSSPLYFGENILPTTLKRTRSVGSNSRRFDASRAPPLPPLNGDLILQVFTHKSLRRPHVPPSEYGDNEKLSHLGKSVFELAITHSLFWKRPMLQASDVSKCRAHLLSSTMIEDWVGFYKLVSKLRYHRDVIPFLKSSPEICDLFHAYVGGVYVSSGPQIVNDWISGLLEQEFEALQNQLDMEAEANPHITPPPKRIKSEFNSPKIAGGSLFYAPQPPSIPLQANPPAFLPNPLAPAQPELPFLPLFNQAAMQRRVTVEYLAEFSGPSHAGRWAVKCIVNRMCKGEGTGNSKQSAKEEAARRAYYSMGWT